MIVSDSTALIILFDLERVELLGNLFGEVFITPIVLEEISVKSTIVLPPFMRVIKLENNELFDTLKKLLDIGESEAIAVVKEKGIALIMDEKKGRKIAKGMGLTVIGLLGVVYLNVKNGFLSKDEAKRFLDNAIEHGYRISPKMLNDMLGAL